MDKAFSTTLSWIMHWFSDKILNPSIIPTEAQCIVHLYQKQPSGQSFFKGAGPVGAVLCLAESTIRIATRGRESTPPGKHQYKNGNVFNRLGPCQTDRTPPTTQQATNRSDPLSASTIQYGATRIPSGSCHQTVRFQPLLSQRKRASWSQQR